MNIVKFENIYGEEITDNQAIITPDGADISPHRDSAELHSVPTKREKKCCYKTNTTTLKNCSFVF